MIIQRHPGRRSHWSKGHHPSFKPISIGGVQQEWEDRTSQSRGRCTYAHRRDVQYRCVEKFQNLQPDIPDISANIFPPDTVECHAPDSGREAVLRLAFDVAVKLGDGRTSCTRYYTQEVVT